MQSGKNSLGWRKLSFIVKYYLRWRLTKMLLLRDQENQEIGEKKERQRVIIKMINQGLSNE